MPGLREIAEADLAITIEDNVGGFGWPITVKDPVGGSQSLIGLSTDIAQIIDPDTGEAVSGRLASVALRISTLVNPQWVEAAWVENGWVGALGLPRGIADSKKAPWTVTFNDIGGVSHTFKVSQSNPDRALGVVTLILEAYKCQP